MARSALELAVGHLGTAGGLPVGAAYPDFSAGGLRDADRAVLGADDAGVPDLEHLDAELGEFAQSVKSSHPGGPAHWNALVHQTAPMVAGLRRLGPETVRAIDAPALVLASGRDELGPSPSSSSPAHSAERPGRCERAQPAIQLSKWMLR